MMKLAAPIKWSLAVAALAGLVAAGVAFSRDRFPGLPVDDTSLALVGGRIYDPAGDSVIDDAIVIVRGRTIDAVGRDLDIPEGARILNVGGLTLLPGYIDSHVHLSAIRAAPDGTRRVGWFRYMWRFSRSFPERRHDLIEGGVTSVKSLGDPYPWIAEMAAAIERHELGGPRIFAGGPMFTAPGGHPVAALRRGGQGDTSFLAQVARQVMDPAAAEAAVREIGADVNFITAVLETATGPEPPRLSPPLLRALAESAHGAGLDLLAHVGTIDDLRLALSTGADGIEHTPSDAVIDPATLLQLRRAGAVVDPTLVATEERLAAAGAGARSRDRARSNVIRMRTAGIPIVVGSDAPNLSVPFGLALHEEMRRLAYLGFTSRELIRAATWRAAEHLGVGDRLGTIAAGKWADIVAVAGDPLTDIGAASDIYLVIADGQLLVDRLDKVRRSGSVFVLGRRPLDGPRRAGTGS